MFPKIGILGGGQLGRMFIQSAMNWNVEVHILDPDPEAPCKDIATSFRVGNLTDEDAVYQFAKDLDVITIEIENVSVSALEKLQAEGKKIYPQPEVIRIIQDKRTQKQFYQQHQIPTADFRLIENATQLKDHLDFLPAFQKLGSGGYDGRGVIKLEDEFHLDRAFDAPSILEKLTDVWTEISVIIARNPKGEIAVFPPVEMVFNPEYNLVDYLLAPAQISHETLQKAEQLARQVITAFDMVGILAIEMFLTSTGELLVNEVAPRPHNSGHQSIEANFTSQYEQHLRAILDLPLGDTQIRSYSAMVNLLGEKDCEGEAIYQGLEEAIAQKGVFVHLYGKKYTKPFRKMGHITILDNDLGKLREKVKWAKDKVKVIAVGI
jgi:5-(carboxyamino)imidazole ribonucleotide synthase